MSQISSKSANAPANTARWIGWLAQGKPEGRANRFAWFRRVVDLPSLPEDTELRFAADSTAQLWVNGVCLRRNVTRYDRAQATCEVVDCRSALRPGRNVVAILVHHWGDTLTFQRTAGGLAGLWVKSSWLVSDAGWKVQEATAYAPHTIQILGRNDLTERVRFPQIVHADRLNPQLHRPEFDAGDWPAASVLAEVPWPLEPAAVETHGQSQNLIRPGEILAAGQATRAIFIENDPAHIGLGITTSTCRKDDAATLAARALTRGESFTLSGKAGETHFVTMDFQRPLHGYPVVDIESSVAKLRVDFGYGELWRMQYDGRIILNDQGWLDTGAIVGARYADRVIFNGSARVELPDERTCRWLTLHVHFSAPGTVVIREAAMLSCQHPFAVAGSFHAATPEGKEDERLAAAVRLCLDHAAVTMTDAFVDTPGREDGQWLEDAAPRGELAARWSGDTTLRRLYVRTVSESQNAEGFFHLFPPSNFPAQWNMADWQIQWGQMLWDEWRWSGDKEMVRRFFPTLERYVTLLLQPLGEDGIWRFSRVLADIRTTQNVPEGGASGLITPWLISRLPRFAELAEAAAQPACATRWRAAAEAMKAAFLQHFLVPAEGSRPALLTDVLDAALQPLPGFSQAGHSEALAEGLIDAATARAMLDYVFPNPDGDPPAGVLRWNNPTYSERVLRALSRHGLGERAMRHLLSRYAEYLPGDPKNPTPALFQGPFGGPLPEYWISREDLGLAPGEINTRQPVDDTGTHGWGAVPLLWLHEHVLGVTIQSPGGAELRIAPDLCGRPRVHGQTCTPRGIVAVDAHADGRLTITVPANTTAQVILPVPSGPVNGPVTKLSDQTIRLTGPGTWEWQAASG